MNKCRWVLSDIVRTICRCISLHMRHDLARLGVAAGEVIECVEIMHVGTAGINYTLIQN